MKHVHPLEVKLTAALLNGLVDDIRREASSKLFKETLRRFSNAAKKRGKSLNDYIDALYRKYSRLLVIRLELSYEMGYFRKSRDLKECLEEVKADWVRLQTDLHLGKPVEGMVGFACKLEYAHLTGFHYHLLLFFDGSSHRQDITLSRLIGEHWHLEITAGKGRYHNCNARTYRTIGIGQICWNETEKLNTLKGVVADYLVKVDYLLRLSPGCGRTFFRGNMPKNRWSRRGRPRSGSAINQRNDI
ncbi:YagK/YfjJ domain-containing protein [Pseudomonas anguilliseptica]|uniref:YagK/YfjJ domain-containing protein n=1 Tax=Pseudomonas anguilliseptica TaxID=53406 RepID=UPI00325C1B00